MFIKSNTSVAKDNAAAETRPEAVATTATTIEAATTTTSSETRGRYANWNSTHAELVAQAWCCVGDLMSFCDKYEYKTLSLSDAKAHSRIVAEVTALLQGTAPFDMRKRFSSDTRNVENLWVCIGRCAGVEYHLKRILNAFRKPLEKCSPEKQRAARQNFHLAVHELRLDISARITEVRLYDRNVFEREFNLDWQPDIS